MAEPEEKRAGGRGLKSFGKDLWRGTKSLGADLWAKVQPTAKPSEEEITPTLPDKLPVPVLWLFGKTGAGKSSLIRAMTGLSQIEIGNGFHPCTRTAQAFDFPRDPPVLRFLDTRGLGEIDYDPSADLAEIGAAAHAVLVVMRLDDPVQGEVWQALARIRRAEPRLKVIALHTAPDQMPDPETRARMQALNQAGLEKVMGGAVPQVTLDLSDPMRTDLTPLQEALADLLPSVVLYMMEGEAKTAEEAEFLRHRGLVLSYAGSATAGGALPVVGAISVPGVQIAMLAALANRYGVEWNRNQLAALAGALGLGAVGGQALGLGARELAKLIPVVGQTLGPVVGASWSGAATWALGRVAGYYFYHIKADRQVDQTALRELFAATLKGQRHGPD